MESLICPVCRATNDQPPVCRRCKADLALLWSVAQQHDRHVAAARLALRRRDLALAAEHLHDAESLQTGPELHQLRAVLHLLRRDFTSAWREAVRARRLTAG
jgi:hypothetical protein